MKKYLVILFNQIKVQMSYKFSFLTGLIAQIISILISIFMWNAIFLSSDASMIGGYTRSQMIFYILLTHLSSLLYSTSSVVRLGGLIRTGRLTMMLLRPHTILGESLATFTGERFFYIVLYIFLFLFISVLGFSPVYIALLILFTVVNYFMFFMFLSVISTLGFWLIQMWPLRPLLNALFLLGGGLYFPLDLLPEPLFMILEKSPFALVAFNYSKALQGMVSVNELCINTVISCAWLLLFSVLYSILFSKGLKRYEGMGA